MSAPFISPTLGPRRLAFFPWTLACAALLLAATGATASADAYDWEFRPGPNVPKGFKPGPNVDASGMDLGGSCFIGMDLRNAKFDGCNLRNARFLQVNLVSFVKTKTGAHRRTAGASFKGADLRDSFFEEPDVYEACDFTDALINGIVVTGGHKHFLSLKQLRSTKSYKIRDLSRCYIMGEHQNGPTSMTIGAAKLMPMRMDLAGFALEGATFAYGDFTDCGFFDATMNRVVFRYAKIEEQQLSQWSILAHDGTTMVRRNFEGFEFFGMDLSGWDFSGATLRETSFNHVVLNGVEFVDADIRHSRFYRSISNEQLRSTKSYREGDLSGIRFTAFDFSGFDFSRQNLTGIEYRWCKFANANFTDAVITCGTFHKCKNLTLAQIKSTWNYKHGRMAGIRLPKELAAALEAEGKDTKETPAP